MQAPLCNAGRGAERNEGRGRRRLIDGDGRRGHRGRASSGDEGGQKWRGGRARKERLGPGGDCPLTDELGGRPAV